MKTRTNMMRVASTMLAMTLGLLAAAPVSANSAAWATNAASGDWGIGANWIGGSAPGATSGLASPDVAIFSNASPMQAIVPEASRNIAGILFTNAACGVYTNGTTTGNKLLLSSGGSIAMAVVVNSNQVINAPLELEGDGGAYTFTNSSKNAVTLAFGGAINGVATGTNVTSLLLTGTNTSYSVVTGIVSDGPNGGKLAVVKSGSGAWYLSGSNTYSGGTILNVGVLRLVGTNITTTPIGTGPFVINGGTIYNGATVVIRATNNMTWNGSFGASFPSTYPLNLGPGSVVLTTNITITVGAGWGDLFTVPGNITETNGSWAISVSAAANPGLACFTGSNSFSGGFTLNSSGATRIGNPWSFGTGPLTLHGGYVQQQTNAALKGITSVTCDGDVSMGGSYGSVNFGTAPWTLVGARKFTLDAGSFTISGNIAGMGSSLMATGTAWWANLYLNGTNSFDGGISLKPGTSPMTLNIGSPWALGTGPLTINSAAGGGVTLDNTSGAALTLSNNNAQAWNTSFTFTGTKSLNMGTGPVTLGTNVTLNATNNTLTIGGPISGSNAWYSLTKVGPGILVFGAANTYTGGTTVTAGRLLVSTNGTLGGGNVLVGTNNAVLDIETTNTIADTATLTLAASATNSCVVILSNSVPDVIAKLVVGTNIYTHAGTYGSTTSGARTQIPVSFSGPGKLMITAPKVTAIFFQ